MLDLLAGNLAAEGHAEMTCGWLAAGFAVFFGHWAATTVHNFPMLLGREQKESIQMKQAQQHEQIFQVMVECQILG